MVIFTSGRDAQQDESPSRRLFRRLGQSLDVAFASTIVIALLAAGVLLLSGCGGSDDTPATTAAPPGNDALTARQIADAQAALDRTTSPIDASSVLGAAQIDAQRAALDGSTTDGPGSIDANQQALDAEAELLPVIGAALGKTTDGAAAFEPDGRRVSANARSRDRLAGPPSS